MCAGKWCHALPVARHALEFGPHAIGPQPTIADPTERAQKVFEIFLCPTWRARSRKRALNLILGRFAVLRERTSVWGLTVQKGLEMRASAFVPVGLIACFEVP